MHIDDWLDQPATDDAEKWAKEFLEKCRRPAIDKCDGWTEAHTLFCTYKGERWRVLGASRLGDVWLTKHFERVNGYDIRIDVADCSEWSKTANAKLTGAKRPALALRDAPDDSRAVERPSRTTG